MKRKPVYLIALTAVLAALTTVAIFYLRVPFANGWLHAGDVVILLAAVLLPTPYAMVVGALGGSMANILGTAFIWAPATAIIKALITVPFSAKQEKLITKRNLVMIAPYAAITIVGYGLYQWMLISMGALPAPDGAWAAVSFNLFGDVIQVLGNATLFVALAAVLDKTKFKQRIGL
ncbi:MAG: ECF transporter S component [Oscillospiraceae bacterium]|nr:ECF transporter S component [Oscillospiraceae bacterium]